MADGDRSGKEVEDGDASQQALHDDGGEGRIQPSRRTQARGSERANQAASPIVSRPTAVAMSRWPCS